MFELILIMTAPCPAHAHTIFGCATLVLTHRISVSSDGRLFAVADAAGSVLLYGHLPHKGALPLKWDLVGKFKAHHGANGLQLREPGVHDDRLYGSPPPPTTRLTLGLF